MAHVDDSTLNDLLCKVNSLQSQLYTTAYKTKLPDKFTYYLPQSKHKLSEIKGYTFLDPYGVEVTIDFKLFADKSVEVNSNISLLNCTLILF